MKKILLKRNYCDMRVSYKKVNIELFQNKTNNQKKKNKQTNKQNNSVSVSSLLLLLLLLLLLFSLLRYFNIMFINS